MNLNTILAMEIIEGYVIAIEMGQFEDVFFNPNSSYPCIFRRFAGRS